ncbi:Rhoptry neck protein 2 [Lasiodiplodia theobromae]|uniref:Uncharacterized protein n=1 Tax=Lasiodiplodia theobromae TaxID=45133 RepID=A0A5N5DT61_9PEZI|nr:Rhoptry neck protein 2 [Lasiodiplodia theobromae]KAB2580933.1 hypothetical protein DBV05_g616 [Lasiodiplodia theobromae]KAF4542364.1 Rhoptry neck protein 2 [Lasiodiplodia theobromae]
MADRDTPRRTGKHRPKDVPHMTDEQKKALCNVPDLYNDPRSLVQIWRDSGVPYQEHVMPPPTAPRAHLQHRRQTSGSQASSAVPSSGSGSARTSMSQALVPVASPPRYNNQQTGNYANGAYNHGNHVTGTYPQSSTAFATNQQQQAGIHPASSMGDPATAYFVPTQTNTNTTATKAVNAENFRVNHGIEMSDFLAKSSDAEIGAMIRRMLPQPGAAEKELAKFYNTKRDSDDDDLDGGVGLDGLGHRRNHTR